MHIFSTPEDPYLDTSDILLNCSVSSCNLSGLLGYKRYLAGNCETEV